MRVVLEREVEIWAAGKRNISCCALHPPSPVRCVFEASSPLEMDLRKAVGTSAQRTGELNKQTASAHIQKTVGLSKGTLDCLLFLVISKYMAFNFRRQRVLPTE